MSMARSELARLAALEARVVELETQVRPMAPRVLDLGAEAPAEDKRLGAAPRNTRSTTKNTKATKKR